MSRPALSRSAAGSAHLAGPLPPSVAATAGLTRRGLLRAALAGAGVAGATGLLSACGTAGAALAVPGTGVVHLGSNASDDVPRAAIARRAGRRWARSTS